MNQMPFQSPAAVITLVYQIYQNIQLHRELT